MCGGVTAPGQECQECWKSARLPPTLGAVLAYSAYYGAAVPKLFCSLVGLVVASLGAHTAFGQTATQLPPAPRLRLAALTGAAIPIGNVTSGVAMSDVTPPAWLIGADVAWGPVLPLDFGITFGVALGLGEPTLCPQPSDACGLAVGGQFAGRVRYYFRAEQRVSPWLGLGGGIDVLRSEGNQAMSDDGYVFQSTIDTKRTASYFGPLGMLQAGVDVRARRKLAFGGLLAFAASAYTSEKDSLSVDGDDVTSSSGTLSPELHAWLYLAAYVTFDVRL